MVTHEWGGMDMSLARKARQLIRKCTDVHRKYAQVLPFSKGRTKLLSIEMHVKYARIHMRGLAFTQV